MRKTKGNIFELAESGKLDVLIYPCNCFHASSIPYTNARKADEDTPYGARKVGTYTCAQIDNFTFINLYTHQSVTVKEQNFDYDALRKVLKKIKKDYSGKKIAYDVFPRGDWEIISKIIDEELEGENHKLINWGGDESD